MARIAGVDLPRNKRMEVALTYIFGIGKPSARRILAEAGVDLDKKSDAVSDDELSSFHKKPPNASLLQGGR